MHHQIYERLFIVLYFIVVLLIPFSIYFALSYMERRGRVLSPKANAWMINSLRVGLFILMAIVMGVIGFLMKEIGIWKIYLPLLAIGLLSFFIHFCLSKKGEELFGMTKKIKEITAVVGLCLVFLPTIILLFLLFEKIGIFGIIIIIGLLGAIPMFIIKGKF